jgi:hypothetical protein
MNQADKITIMREARDTKVRVHLDQYAPVWMVRDTPQPDDESLLFDVVFYHPDQQWVNRRYRFDAFTDVLYNFGQILISEEVALAIQEQPPYISAEVVNTVNSYGG